MFPLLPEWPVLSVFLLGALAVGASPGPGMFYTIARSMGDGRAAGVVSVLGLATGSFMNCLAGALGLAALLAVSELAYDVVRYAGAAYLLYLAIRMVRQGGAFVVDRRATRDSNRRIFSQAVITNVVNPKSALFYLSFLPQFIDPERGSVLAQFILLGLIFNIWGNSINLAVGLGFGHIGEWLGRHPGFWRGQRWFSAAVLAGLAMHLAIASRR